MLDCIKKHLKWIVAVGFAVLNIVLSLRYVGIVTFDEDPWIAMYGAKRILEGQLLYKNFFDFVTPGTDYLLAGIFSIFGTKLSVAQFAVVLSNAAVTAIVVFVSFDIIKNKWLRLLPGLLFSLYSAYVYYVSHHWFILLPAILALFTGVRIVTLDTGKPNKWFFTGLASAGAFLFIQSIGITLFGMVVLFIVWYYANKSYRRGILLRSVIYYIIGFFIPIIIVVIVFTLSGSLHAFIYDSFIWPFSHYREINLSTPSDFLKLWIKELSIDGFLIGIIYSFVAYFGILLSLAAFVYAAVKINKDKTQELSLLAIVSFFCMGIVAGLLPNSAAFHLMVFMPVYMLAVIIIFEYAPFWSSRLIKAGFYFYFISITLVISYNAYRYFLAYNKPANAVEIFQTPVGKVKMYKGYKSIISPSYPYPLLKELNMKLPKHIFVLYWSPSIYMLTGSDNPAPLNTYIPYYNTKEQAMSVIKALGSSHTRVIIIDNRLGFVKKRIGWLIHDQRVFSAEDPLITYIHTHYRQEKVIPGYTIYKLIKQ